METNPNVRQVRIVKLSEAPSLKAFEWEDLEGKGGSYMAQMPSLFRNDDNPLCLYHIRGVSRLTRAFIIHYLRV